MGVRDSPKRSTKTTQGKGEAPPLANSPAPASDGAERHWLRPVVPLLWWAGMGIPVSRWGRGLSWEVLATTWFAEMGLLSFEEGKRW
jgi:hypothetical protein